jgi:hypothetical protein
MKKIAAMLLVLLMLAGLCACQNGEPTNGETQVNLPPIMEVFPDGRWQCRVVLPGDGEFGEELLVVTFHTSEELTYGYKTYYTNNPHNEQVFDQVEHQGKTYLDLTFSGSMGGFTFEELENGNVRLEMMTGTILELTVVAEDQVKVVSSNREDFVPAGTVFSVLENK